MGKGNARDTIIPASCPKMLGIGRGWKNRRTKGASKKKKKGDNP